MGINETETIKALSDIFNRTIQVEKDLLKISEELIELERAITGEDQIEEKEEEVDE